MPKKIKIRRARAWDVVEIAKLLLQGFVDQANDVWRPKPTHQGVRQIAHVLTLIDLGLVVVAEQEVDERIVAVIGMSVSQAEWSDEWFLQRKWFYVMPGFKGIDVAANLLRYVETWADRQINPDTQKGLPIVVGNIDDVDDGLKKELTGSHGFQSDGEVFVRAPFGSADENAGSDGEDEWFVDERKAS